jgi:hypothetical protein
MRAILQSVLASAEQDGGLRRIRSEVRRPGQVAAAVLAAVGLWLIAAAGPLAAPASAATPPTSASPTSVVSSRTSVPVAPATTVVPIGNQLPAPPVTLPLTTHPESVHVDPLLAKLSLGGFALVILMLLVQWGLTRPRRRKRRWTL